MKSKDGSNKSNGRNKMYEDALEKLEGNQVKADFLGFHIFIYLYDGDIDVWEQSIRSKSSDHPHQEDLPFVLWLKDYLATDEDLINRIRKLVQFTTPMVEKALRDAFDGKRRKR